MRLTRTARLVVVAGQLVLPFTLAQDYVSVLESVTSEAYGPSPTPSTIGALSSVSTISSAPSPSQTSSSNEPKVHIIKAGAGGFKFTPQEIQNVSVGDIVSWEFYPRDHSVARAEFGSACVPYEYTGKDKITHFNITINSTEPIFFYCAAPDSCRREHMVGAINPNSTQTLASQVHSAAMADFQVAPGEPIPAEASSTLSAAPTSTGTPPANSGGKGNSHVLSAGAIAGIVVGGVAFLVICAALFFFVGRSKSLKETLKRRDATNTMPSHMSQPYGGGANYGDGGLASPGFQPSRPGYATPPPPGHHADYGFGSPPQYGQHAVGEAHPSGWSSPSPQPGHLSMMSNTSGMSQQQIDQLKYAHMNAQPTVAELHSPPLGHQSFSAELEAPNNDKGATR
ncbi:uncharacterized protein SETTUDRAFT_107372 [Exserohilum turcica Et28A]|uniref:Extracellular serine-rich protein n=1 Tax=Exserohilum turcicum (strain 28A) TaxID=671987 RepID=R0KK34_EXST2|nr:uncharacterized protein SETTUDRAFT_107372 [Exserohilum turcica Et28A]EOA88362.1 hypothetical protein SETTUDRAFT_107372 [Exserohilum turcica Et28A]